MHTGRFNTTNGYSPHIEVEDGWAFLDAELLDPSFRGIVFPVRLGNLSRKEAS